MEAVLFVGVQGSGKTTFYKERFFDTHVRISRDMLKTRNRQSLLVSACLAGRQPFVVDDTNAAKSRRAEFIEPARAAGFRVRCFFFRCALREALGTAAGELLLLADAGAEVVPASAFRPLSRARLRLAAGEVVP